MSESGLDVVQGEVEAQIKPMIPLVLLTRFGAPATRPHNSIPQPNSLLQALRRQAVGGLVELHTGYVLFAI